MLFYLSILFNHSNAQSLNVKETISYIRNQYQTYSLDDGLRRLSEFDIKISNDGYIKMFSNFYYKSATPSFDIIEISFHYTDIAKIDIGNGAVRFGCKPGKYIFNPRYPSNTQINSTGVWATLEPKIVERLLNAFTYLFSLLASDPNYNLKDDDPFSPWNFKKDISSSANKNIIEVLLFDHNGVSSIEVQLCGLKKRLIFDSGASEVSISQKTESELINLSMITKNDYLASGLYRIPDGSIISARRFVIPFIKVGDFKVSKVICSVNPSEDIELLGNSFLNKFSKWSIDNDKNTLVLTK